MAPRARAAPRPPSPRRSGRVRRHVAAFGTEEAEQRRVESVRSSQARASAASSRPKPKRRKLDASQRLSAFEARKKRAFKHRLFLISRDDASAEKMEFAVLGSTGNVYYQVLQPKTVDRCKCSCVDQRTRKLWCKHLLFLMLRVLGVEDSHACFDRSPASLTLAELQAFHGNAPDRVSRDLAASGDVRAMFSATTGGQVHIDRAGDAAAAGDAADVEQRDYSEEDCAICYEELVVKGKPKEAQEPVDFCKRGCGRSLHATCFSHWAKASTKGVPGGAAAAKCPLCRSPWEKPDAAGGRLGRHRVMNLARYQDADEDYDEDGDEEE